MSLKGTNPTGWIGVFSHLPNTVNASLHEVPRDFFNLVNAEEKHAGPTDDSPTHLWFKVLHVANVVFTFYCIEPPEPLPPVAELWQDEPDEEES
jgi:hypothetical protein